MNRSLVVMILTLLATCAVAVPAVAQNPVDPIKQIPAGLTYEIDSREKGVRVPLVRNEHVEVDNLKATVLDVARGLARNPALLQEFKPEIVEGALVIAVPHAPLPQATYDVGIEIRLKVAVKGLKEMQTLNLRITQPPAQLRNPDTLVIERSIGPWSSMKTPNLPLKESSWRSGLSSVEIRQLDKLPGVGKDGSPALTFKTVEEIAPGGMVWVPYSLEAPDGLPLGIVKGSLEVNAVQLASPLPVAFEIHTRRTVWWIFLFAPFGLLCGLLLRTVLPGLVTLDQVRLQAIDVLSRVDREENLRKDPDFQTNAARIRADLAAATTNRAIKADALTKVLSSAVDALNQELAALEVRLADARRKAEQLSKVVETPWLMPKEMSDILAAGAASLASARQTLLQNDAKDAVEQLDSAQETLTKNLASPIRDWPGDISRLLRVLDDPDVPVPANMAQGLEVSLQNVSGLLSGVTDPGPAPDLATLEQALGAIHKARSGVQQLLLGLKDWPTDTLADVEEVLRPAPMKDMSRVKALDMTARELLKTLDELSMAPEAGDPEPAALKLRTGLQKLADAWRDALFAQIAPDQKEAIAVPLAARNYRAAAREVVRRLQTAAAAAKAVQQGGARQDLEIRTPEATQDLAAWEGISGMRFGVPDWAPARPPLDLSPAKIEAGRLLVTQELLRVIALRTTLVWVGVIGLSFLLFRDKVGTVQDFAASVIA